MAVATASFHKSIVTNVFGPPKVKHLFISGEGVRNNYFTIPNRSLDVQFELKKYEYLSES
jgi:hypothetical protein